MLYCFTTLYAMRRQFESVNTEQRGCLSEKLQKFTRINGRKVLL